MVAKVVETFGGLDVMVANAGIIAVKPVLETSAAEYEHVLSVNATGTFLCFKYAAAQMIKQGRGGRIIGASSLAGKMGANALSAYCSSKFAIRGLTQTCAAEWAKHNITVNSYAPGIIRTPMVANPDDPACAAPDVFKAAVGLPPTTPEADPSDVAGLVSYLVRPESQFVNGQCLNINGGVLCG